ncbi:tetratricopeptide repeat protein [Acidiphilium sp. AL]|uniref:CHAT domain-containing protein n=1 Tax=Acidiphilium sp. AL TaxID=2871704 RepID=UPI0021CB523F|nr:tetratricopeptide repeat protein [Acidiphilium sp. AL]MCU4161989.1 tetratricopeptide repeat protein [Acidiphilium sp. AL]
MDEDAGRADSLGRDGEVALDRGNYAEAKVLFDAALTVRRRLAGDQALSVADLLNLLGRIGVETGDFPAAMACFEESLALRRRSLGNNHLDVAASFNNLGILYKEAGDYTAARKHHENALAIRRVRLGPDDKLIGLSLANLGNVARASGDYAKAVAHQRDAIAIWRRGLGPDHPYIAAGLTNLGNVLIEIGDFEAARDCHEQALDIRRASFDPDHPNIANSLHNLGNALTGLGDYTAAAASHAEALAIWRRALGDDNPDVAAALESLGSIESARGDHVTAAARLAESFSIRRRVLGDNHPDTGLSLYLLARSAQATGDLEAARVALRDAARIASLPDGITLRHQVWQGFAEIEAASGNTGAAIFFGKQAVNVIQGQRGRLDGLERALQRRYAETNARIYRHLADLLVRESRLAEAECVLAMLKEEELFELLRRDVADDPRLTFLQLTALEARWQRHGDTVIASLARCAATGAQDEDAAVARAELEAAVQAFDRWIDGLRAAFATRDEADARDVRSLNLATRQEIQTILAVRGDDIALVHYLASENRLIILVTTPDYQVSREVAVARHHLNRLVHEFRFAIEQTTEDVDRIAIALHGMLVAPIADLIAETGIATLLLAPAGALRYLPFAALHDGTAFLIERVAIAMDTAAARDRVAAAPRVHWRVAGFGVTRDVAGYRQLGTVTDELRRIIQDIDCPGAQPGIFPGRIHLDAEFTRDRLVDALRDHTMIHIASHFRFDPVSERGSHLLLGDGDTLTLEDLRDPEFRFETLALIALSACETAMGGGPASAHEGGAEIEGFGALVRRRGAGAVLASLWPVADDSTPALMEVFYRGIRAGLGFAEALRAAQRTLIGSNDPTLRHPQHWAAFILIGDGQ